MAAESIHARCRNCDHPLLLSDIAPAGGRCPNCDELFAPGYTFLLLEEVRRAETLQRSLILSLRRLQGLPGNLSLDVESVLRSALADIDRNEQLADDRDIMRRRAAEIRPRTREWRALPGPERRRHARSLVAAIRSLAQRLRRHADLVEQDDHTPTGPEPDPAALRESADQVDASADAVAEDRRRSDDIVRDAMAAVEDRLGHD